MQNTNGRLALRILAPSLAPLQRNKGALWKGKGRGSDGVCKREVLTGSILHRDWAALKPADTKGLQARARKVGTWRLKKRIDLFEQSVVFCVCNDHRRMNESKTFFNIYFLFFKKKKQFIYVISFLCSVYGTDAVYFCLMPLHMPSL